jgi:hypothetical protein
MGYSGSIPPNPPCKGGNFEKGASRICKNTFFEYEYEYEYEYEQ